MVIQWFPGHMTKALRLMEKELDLSDIIFYVLDARAPKSCVNPSLNKVIGNKPIIYILNKSDLANEVDNKKWKDFFTTDITAAILTESTKSKNASGLINLAQSMLKEKMQKYVNKGINKSIRAMVIGVPNCGKSTLVNNLCGKARAETGNRPGVTKGKQWVRVSNNFEVLDTPGTLWPSFDDNKLAENLAFIGSIKDEVLDIVELAEALIVRLQTKYQKGLIERYGLTGGEKPQEVIDMIAKKRGFLQSGGIADLEKASICFLDEFRSGKLGRITLD